MFDNVEKTRKKIGEGLEQLIIWYIKRKRLAWITFL